MMPLVSTPEAGLVLVPLIWVRVICVLPTPTWPRVLLPVKFTVAFTAGTKLLITRLADPLALPRLTVKVLAPPEAAPPTKVTVPRVVDEAALR